MSGGPAASDPAEGGSDVDPADLATRRATPKGPLRWALLALGFAAVGAGMVGVVVPGLPTTVFMLIALWAFARSSRRFHDWLYHHPRFGPPLRDWTLHGVVPRRAKTVAIATMGVSVALVGWVWRDIRITLALAVVLALVAAWLATRPERPAPDRSGP